MPTTRKTYFAEVILPLALPNTFTYRVPHEMNENIVVGKRVIVQFGKKRLYSGIVESIHENPPKVYQAKYIDSILDDFPIVNSFQFKFWRWISEYYLCTIGEVMNAALPTGLKLVSKTKIVLNSIEYDVKSLSDKEYLIVEALEVRSLLEMSDVEKILDIKTVYPIIKSLLEKEIILVAEQVHEKYKPKLKKYIRLPEKYDSEEQIKEIFEKLTRATKQQDLFMMFLHLKNSTDKDISRELLIKESNAKANAVSEVVKKGFLEEFTKETTRILPSGNKIDKIDELTVFQQNALLKIKKENKEYKTVLLHGVTGSGKTEIYIKLIEEQLKLGKQILYLLPEIALTTQIITRIRKKFGDKVGIYHSKFNANERVEVWNELLKNEKSRFQIVVGARSAVFLPFSNLGLVIVDEEHDSSYKQNEPSPRYNGKDASLYIANMHDCNVLLGSATPSVETYWNAKNNKFGLVTLSERYGGIKLPDIVCADIGDAKKKNKMKSHFTQFLLDEMKRYLDNKEQIILFQNRRGYNPLWNCDKCGWVPECKNCDISLTYHKYSHQLKCHYCGYAEQPYAKCKSCGSNSLQMIGFGTEKIEEELAVFFPDKVIKRMDYDTTRNKNGYQNIIDNFEQGLIDILVGTQMVTKGLDFDNVGLVGVLNADSLFHYPDFRACERSFQMLTQVSGRAGRKGKQGKVIIQTYSPENEIIKKVIENDFTSMYHFLVHEREEFYYPPFYRLIRIIVKHRNREVSLEGSEYLTDLLKKQLKGRVFGPETPAISRVKNQYINQIMIKFEAKISAVKLKLFVQETVDKFQNMDKYKASRVVLDVDFY